MMSGLVPLSADVMRYLLQFTRNFWLHYSPTTSSFRVDYALGLRKDVKRTDTRKYRTEIAIQAQSFGAALQRE